MTKQLSRLEAQVMWVVGAAERLATLGVFDSNVPLRIASNAIDEFLLIDEYRNRVFESDEQVAEIFKTMARCESEEEIDDESMSAMVDLILDYKNDREHLVKYALSHQMV